MSEPGPTVRSVEIFLIAVVAVLWWKLGQARRQARQVAQALSATPEAMTVVRGALMATTEGYAYWFSGAQLFRAPLIDGQADRDHAEPADPAICEDLTPMLVAEVIDALQGAAEDLLHGRGGEERTE